MFSNHAIRLRDNGFDPIPLAGKQPIPRGWQHPLGWERLQRLCVQYADANIGLLTNNLCVIDIDLDDRTDAHNLSQIVSETLGQTGFIRIGRWPRLAMFYRVASPTKSRRIGPVDILGAGKQVAVAGHHPGTCAPYYWPEDSLLDADWSQLHLSDASKVEKLVTVLEGEYGQRTVRKTACSSPLAASPLPAISAVKGRRNQELFNHLRVMAAGCPDIHALLDEACTFAAACDPPLSGNEATATARSVWSYKENGTLLTPGQPGFIVQLDRRTVFAICKEYPLALSLYTVLAATRPHSEPFTIPIKATAKKLGMGHGTIQNAIKALDKCGVLSRCGQLAAKPGQRGLSLYHFTTPVRQTGQKEGHV